MSNEENLARESSILMRRGYRGRKKADSLNSTSFDKLQNQPGELIWDFLERIARPRRVRSGAGRSPINSAFGGNADVKAGVVE
jgi:hypothetical protein